MSSHPAPRIRSFEDSQFCRRLQQLANASGSSTELQNLHTATQRLVGHADAISNQIVRHLPQFTLHNGTHLWNVLSFMEELAGGSKEIEKLGAGDCAMAIWAAFIHDLGMVLEAGELAALDAADHFDATATPGSPPTHLDSQRVQAWRAYRDGSPHWSVIRKDPQAPTNRMRLGIVRAAFIRDSHARFDIHTGHCRIAEWLEAIAKDDPLLAQAMHDYSLEDRIVRVAVSHNQDIRWLPRQLTELGFDPRSDDCGVELGHIHWSWIGWLLRLADVFDCDASRTPRILFDHAGITDSRSRKEWMKHLALREAPAWESGHDHQTLLYTSHHCPGPVVEKSLGQIIGWMNDEIRNCLSEWLAVPEAERRTLRLPSKAEIAIKKREGNYLYQDIEFRLDRDAVVELLMGESLYGGPELALRELVQNALDAVHLRDQRNQLAIALEKAGNKQKARQPHEAWGAKAGEVHVTWGRESDGRQWIKVQDNGVGMTVGTLRRFLTQVGKSYYKSDDFHAEQELMRRHGILCTAISQFGIGFLSVFMLADHVEIHTRPLGAEDQPPSRERDDLMETGFFPFRADIHGPHGLLAFYPDPSITQPGTCVTLWLKDSFVLADWDREMVLARLKKEFYESEIPSELRKQQSRAQKGVASGKQWLEPAFEIGRFIVWPLSPIHLGPQENPIRLDDRFHFRELVPLNTTALAAKAKEWDEEIPEASHADWGFCEWTDHQLGPNGAEGTGTRIRMVTVQPKEDLATAPTPQRWSELPDVMLRSGKARSSLAVFAEPQLPGPDARYQCLVNGVRIVPGLVPSISERDCQLPEILRQTTVWPGAGSWLWVDLRGSAMPKLRADRSALVRSQLPTWDLRPLLARWLEAWRAPLPAWVSTSVYHPPLRQRVRSQARDTTRLGIAGLSPTATQAHWILEGVGLRTLYRSLPGELHPLVARDLDLDLDRDRDHDRTLARALALALALSLALARDRTRALARAIARDRARTRARELANVFDQGRILKRFKPREIALRSLAEAHLVSEGLWPTLPNSLPALGWTTQTGHLRDYHLQGPLHTDTVDHTTNPEWLQEYDLVAPYSGFALPRLRRVFPKWMEHRAYRALYLLPLLFGSAPKGWNSVLPVDQPIDRLMLFIPNPAQHEWLFAEHTREEWSEGSASAIWDLKTGEVLYADGVHTESSLRQAGQPLEKWLGIDDLHPW